MYIGWDDNDDDDDVSIISVKYKGGAGFQDILETIALQMTF